MIKSSRYAKFWEHEGLREVINKFERESLSFEFTSYYELREFTSFELIYEVGLLMKDQVTQFYESYRILRKLNLSSSMNFYEV